MAAKKIVKSVSSGGKFVSSAKTDTQKTIEFMHDTIKREGSIRKFAFEAGVVTKTGKLTKFYKETA